MLRKAIYVITTLFAVASLSVFGGGWEDYKPNTFAAMESDFLSYANTTSRDHQREDHYFLPGSPFKSTVVYLGEKRPVSSERYMHIRLWAKSFNLDSTLAASFRTEIRVSEGKKVFWVPIQEILVPHLDREVGKNENVMLYVVLVGAVKRDAVFLVNEFNL